MEPRALSSVTARDCASYRIWSSAPSRDGQLWIRPLTVKKTRSFANRMVSCQVTLACGKRVWTLIKHLHVELPEFTEHWRAFFFLLPNGKWFALARYHDAAYTDSGPKALAKALKLKPSEVFPFKFDVSDVCTVDSVALSDEVPEKPRKRLSISKLTAMVVP